MRVFHVGDVKKSVRCVSYTISIENDGVIETSVPFEIRFNKDVLIYNSTILYMFESIWGAEQNAKARESYGFQVDLEPDVDLVELRKGYENYLLADGTGLDSHAIRMLAKGCKCMRYATLVDLKGVELENIPRAEYDTEDSVIITGTNYLRNRSIGDVRLDFTHDGNRLYLLMLLLDHFRVQRVLTADCEKLSYRSYYGSTTWEYTCNFLYGDFGTAYVNAVLDPVTYFDRLLNCGFYPPYKNLRKYLIAKYIEKAYGFEIFSGDKEKLFLDNNKINIAGTPSIMSILESYRESKTQAGGLQLLDSFVLALVHLDTEMLRKNLVHTVDQERVFDGLISFAKNEYNRDKQHYDSVSLISIGNFMEAFGNGNGEFSAVVLPRLRALVRRLMRTNANMDNKTPEFSVIMPTFNRVGLIARAVDSLVAQTYENWELVIVDDGSTDGTVEFLERKYAELIKEEKIRILPGGHHGVCKARNLGLGVARGEWIAYLDSDNAIRRNFMELFKTAIARNPGCLTFYAKLEFINSKRIIGKEFDLDALKERNFIDIGTFVHHRSLVETCGSFDERMTRLVDWELIIRYCSKARPIMIDEIVLDYEDAPNEDRITRSESYYSNLAYIKIKHCPDLPMVTTVVTAYNHEKFIREALDSAIRQEGPFVHRICVYDDASKDSSRAIVREYAAKHPHLVHDCSNDVNVGIAANMKRAFSEARGKFVAVLEGDDIWSSKDKLAKQVRFLEEHPESPMVFNRVKLLKDGRLSVHPGQNGFPPLMNVQDCLAANPDVNPIVNFSSCVFRTELMRDLPPELYEYRLSEIPLAFYLVRKGPIGHIAEPLSTYRINAGGTWSGASWIEKQKQRRECRVTAMKVCDPSIAAEFKFQVCNVDRIVCDYWRRHAEGKLKARSAELKKVKLTLRNVEATNARNAAASRKLAAEVAGLRDSTAYRVGMFVTWPARRVYRGLKCWKENGLKYTLRRLILGKGRGRK